MKNITALITCFARAYHNEFNECKIFNDPLAIKILAKEEFDYISKSMIKSINLFNPQFIGSDNDKLEYIVNNNLAPTVLARSKFAKDKLDIEIKLGVKQYLVFASGYDASSFRINSNLKKFEIDKSDIIEDKIKRLVKANIDYSSVNFIKSDLNDDTWKNELIDKGFKENDKSFCTLLGISYYLTKEQFNNLIHNISSMITSKSAIVFDYPNEIETEKEKINKQLAGNVNEKMKSNYSYKDIEKIAEDNDLLIYEHMSNSDIDNNYFKIYNTLNKNKIYTPVGVSYCLLIKK